MLDFGLPGGFFERVESRSYGPALIVHFAGRLDQIHFKLYATVDHQGVGKHDADLRALNPTREELLRAADWIRTHDPSDALLEELRAALPYYGVPGDALRA